MAIHTMDTRWPAPSNSSNDSPTRHRMKCSLTWVTGSMTTSAPASFTSTVAAETTSPGTPGVGLSTALKSNQHWVTLKTTRDWTVYGCKVYYVTRSKTFNA